MTLKENLIYLEQNLSALKNELIIMGVKLRKSEIAHLNSDIELMNNLLSIWRSRLKR